MYEAEHELLGVRRALKVLSRQLADREDMAERLRLEARALAQLKHPNLVEVNDLGVSSDGRVFFAMELLVGATLRDTLREKGTLRHGVAINLACEILDALHAAHERGMVHRDVKPENIWVQKAGSAKLLDFGVAKAVGGREGHALTQQGTTVGTPRYMAPEQAESSVVDRRVDVFAVGLVLYECLVGRTPFADLDAMAAMVAAVTRGIPSVGAALSGPVLPQLIVCIDRATARQPADRFPTAAALRDELLRLRPLVQGGNEDVTVDRSSLVPSAYAATENALTTAGATGLPERSTVTDLAASTMPFVVAVRSAGIDSTVRLAPGDRGSSPSFPPASLDRRASPTPTAVPIAPGRLVRTQPLLIGTGMPGGYGPVGPAGGPGAAPVQGEASGRSSRALLLLPVAIVVLGLAIVGAIAFDRALRPAPRSSPVPAAIATNAESTAAPTEPSGGAPARTTVATVPPVGVAVPAATDDDENPSNGGGAPVPLDDGSGRGRGIRVGGAGGAPPKTIGPKGGILPKSGL